MSGSSPCLAESLKDGPGSREDLLRCHGPNTGEVVLGQTAFPLLLDCRSGSRALPTETKVESGTSQSKSGTSVNLSNRGDLKVMVYSVMSVGSSGDPSMLPPSSKRMPSGREGVASNLENDHLGSELCSWKQNESVITLGATLCDAQCRGRWYGRQAVPIKA